MIKFKPWGPHTFTVGELIEKLKDYPENLAVIAAWEGTERAVYPPCFEVSSVTYPSGTTPALIIDVEETYKWEEPDE